MRPSFDDYFMSIAYLIATRATCDRKHVGAILVKNMRLIATGYNGSASGMPHCDGPQGHLLKEIEGKPSCVRTLHAESNAIDQAGSDSRLSKLYTTVIPCFDCAKRIVNAGIIEVVYAEYYASRSTELVEQYFADSPNCFLRKWEGQLIIPQAPEEVLKRTARLQEGQ